MHIEKIPRTVDALCTCSINDILDDRHQSLGERVRVALLREEAPHVVVGQQRRVWVVVVHGLFEIVEGLLEALQK